LRSNVNLRSQVPGRRDVGQVIFLDGVRAGAYLSERFLQPRAFRHSLNHTLAFIRDLDRARNLEDVSAQVMRYVAPFGVEHMVASTIPGPQSSRKEQLGQLLLNRWPEEWTNRYASRGYLAYDATIRRMMSSPEPFRWNELGPLVQDNPNARRVLAEATEFNLREGYAFSLQTLDKQTVGFSAGGRHTDMSPDTQGMLTLVATYAIGRAIALKQENVPDAPIILSAREREALQWAAEGKNDWEIGEVMSISEHGADKHMRSVRTKLGAINRTQAVAEAIRRGLIA
jgi:LuxR family transcriptional regulator, quorum-sensing system regulator BjaR1